MNIKIEYKYIQSNIFIVSATYLFKPFNCISFQTKRLQKKKILFAGGSWLFFVPPSRWIGNEQLFKVGLEDVLKTSRKRLADVLKASWSRLENILKTLLQDVLKMFWRRLEDVWPRRIYWSWRRLLKTYD